MCHLGISLTVVLGEAAEESCRHCQLASLAPQPHQRWRRSLFGGTWCSAEVGPGVGRGTFLRGTLWETDGHHKVIQHRALWQLHQSHIVLKCVGVIPGMKEDVFDPEMLFSIVWPVSPMFTWARRRHMRHGGNGGTEDKVTLTPCQPSVSSSPCF